MLCLTPSHLPYPTHCSCTTPAPSHTQAAVGSAAAACKCKTMIHPSSSRSSASHPVQHATASRPPCMYAARQPGPALLRLAMLLQPGAAATRARRRSRRNSCTRSSARSRACTPQAAAGWLTTAPPAAAPGGAASPWHALEKTTPSRSISQPMPAERSEQHKGGMRLMRLQSHAQQSSNAPFHPCTVLESRKAACSRHTSSVARPLGPDPAPAPPSRGPSRGKAGLLTPAATPAGLPRVTRFCPRCLACHRMTKQAGQAGRPPLLICTCNLNKQRPPLHPPRAAPSGACLPAALCAGITSMAQHSHRPQPGARCCRPAQETCAQRSRSWD
jgi:hypothetical protein